MTQHNRARLFLVMAHKDFRAIRAMTDDAFAVEIFGFHAQQAAEKALKAWLEHLGGIAPITHNLVLLISMLGDLGQDMTGWLDLIALNGYAVQYRYEQYDSQTEELDRVKTIGLIDRLLTTVDQVVGYSE